jgi:hypothetical protein
MTRRLLLVLLPLALAAASVWFWQRAQDASASVPALEPDPERGATAPQPERGPDLPAPHAAGTRIAAAPSAASARATSRPVAEGPEYEVLVLDEAARAPVAGADVWWSDATSGMGASRPSWARASRARK